MAFKPACADGRQRAGGDGRGRRLAGRGRGPGAPTACANVVTDRDAYGPALRAATPAVKVACWPTASSRTLDPCGAGATSSSASTRRRVPSAGAGAGRRDRSRAGAQR